MKYLLTLLLGLLCGAAIFVAAMIYNPFVADRGISPLAVTDSKLISLSFSNVPSEAIVFTNDGDSQKKPFPEKVLQLWEASIRQSSAMATVMRDARGQTAGVGVKFSSLSERTRLLQGKALVDSVWYVYLPEHGSLFIEQFENHWTFFRDVGLPAYRNGAKNWKGNWIGDLTAGPEALGTAAVTGGAGALQGLRTLGVESLSARAYSAENGPVSAEGRLLIEVPADSEESESAAPDE